MGDIMGLFDIFKKKKKPTPKKLTAKEQAEKDGKPYVEVLSTNIDPERPTEGYFELDWNDKFITQLVRAGYKGEKQEDIIDTWFTDLCRQMLIIENEKDNFIVDVDKIPQRREEEK
jgi:hypothetical protein